MTKEKLKLEAENKLDEWTDPNMRCCEGYCYSEVADFMFRFSEPREKQISELKDTLEKVETERIQLIAKLAFTENALNNCKAKIENAVELITKLSQLEHRADDCFTYNEYLELIKDAKQFLNGGNEMQEKSNNLRFENDEPPINPSSVKTNDVAGYIHCDDENLNNEQLSWTLYYSYDDELRNNLKSIIASDMSIDEKVNIIIALCSQTMVQVPTENPNPYNQPKVWYCNSKPEYCTNAKCTDATKPNPYMPYEYCSTQLKSDTENNDLVHVPVAGTISAELYSIIKDKLEHGIEYHECDGTRINKKEYKKLYNLIGHNYDDVRDNAEISDFKLPDVKGWYIRIK